jgi:hypothetical protein
MRGETVTKRVNRNRFVDARHLCRHLDRLLNHRVAHVMPTHDTGARVGGQRPARKHPEPGKLPAGIRILAVRASGIHTPASPARRSASCCASDLRRWARSSSLPISASSVDRSLALAAAEYHQPLVEVEILDPKLAALRHPQSAAVDERRH